jgi:TDG/mug DNA glycosylase family protein
MDDRTVEIYEAGAEEWARSRPPKLRDAARAFAAAVAPGAVRADLGSGPGSYTADLGQPVVALDAAYAMVAMARDAAPGAWCVQGDLEHLPFRNGSLGGAWARASYLHVAQQDLPLALAQLHRATALGALVAISMKRGRYEGSALPGDDFPGRFFACWEPEPLAEVVAGAGFEITETEATDGWIHLLGRRVRTLPDYVAPGLRVLVCGLNPSLYAADAGVGFARPGNRFWPAALAAGLVRHDRDPGRAVRDDRVGMTDLVKRATVSAGELTAAEYREGAARVERIVRRLEPAVVCFVGLTGYRTAVDRHAAPGEQERRFGGATTYVMPNTSGVNAHATLADLTRHLEAVAALSSRPRAR